MPSTTENPVIPGFNPDPSIVRVGDEYFLATSSFEYYPAIPLYHSTDLVRWEAIGHVATRESQLPYSDGRGSSGVYAPTLRYHGGEFWLVVTFVGGEERGQRLYRATSAYGPWSEPTLIPDAVGIDPDLSWDEEGRAILTWCQLDFDSHSASIRQADLDPDSGRLTSSIRRLWSGTGMTNPEAPHLYSRGAWWYLVIAEGGTERGHSVSIARGSSPRGPFTGHPANPILSHRSTKLPVQNVGHADLVELPDGTWATVFLGVRAAGKTPRFHVNGRETFLAAVDWVDDWPVIDETRFDVPPSDTTFTDDFTGEAFHPRWVAPGAPPARFARRAAQGGLELTAARADERPRRLLCARAVDLEWTAEVNLTVGDGIARVLVHLDDEHWYGVLVTANDAVAESRVGQFRTSGDRHVVGSKATVRVSAIRDLQHGHPALRGGPDAIRLDIRSGSRWRTLAEWDGRYLSTEVAGGFTGRMLAIEPVQGTIRVLDVEYRPGRPTEGDAT